MKTIYILLFTILSLTGFTQTQATEKIKITSAKIMQAVKVADVLDINIKSCKVLSYHFNITSGKHVNSIVVKEENFTEEIKVIIKKLKKGDTFTIENVVYDCPVIEYKKNFTYEISL